MTAPPRQGKPACDGAPSCAETRPGEDGLIAGTFATAGCPAPFVVQQHLKTE